MRIRRSMIALAALAVLGAACQTGNGRGAAQDSPTPTTAPDPTGTATAGEREVLVYYIVDSQGRMWLTPERHKVTAGDGVARAALEELVRGEPQDPDHESVVPEGARILGLTIADGTATVDWSAEVLEANVGAEAESLGIQSIVYTLTQFDTVERVRFRVEGKTSGAASNGRAIEDWWGHVGLSEQPFTRDEAIRVLAPIVVFAPVDGARVGDSFTVSGEASTFEANVAIRLIDASGKTVKTVSTTATEAAPGRGTFETVVTIENPPATQETWRLEAFESSPRDGDDTFVESRRIVVGG